jgi:imidazolonepropionase-like amidohydrolase
MRGFCGLLIAVAVLLATVSPCAAEAAKPLAIKAERIYVGNGETIRQGVILIEGGRIRALGPNVAVPKGTSLVELDGGCVTPGLIDANARLEAYDLIAPSRKALDQPPPADDREAESAGAELTNNDLQLDAAGSAAAGGAARAQPARVAEDGLEPEYAGPLAAGVQRSVVISEQSSEVVPYIRVCDSLNFESSDFQRLVRAGVTTVYASPDGSSVIGPRGAVVRTAGPLEDRVLVAAGAVKATIGSEPSSLGTYNREPGRRSVSIYTRRPESRMGLTWVFRKAFYDAIGRAEGRKAYGADTSSAEASAVLREVLDGKVPLRIQARLQQDIHTALRLAKEFKLRFTFEEATEAYRCIDTLRAAGMPVIFGPIYARPSGVVARSGEGRRSRYYTFRALLEAGIPTALSAQDLREEDGLARQAMYAMRFGVSFDDALRAVTQTPAELLGLDDQLGTLEPGKRADLVLWSGQPFAATSSVTVVLIDGSIVVDKR